MRGYRAPGGRRSTARCILKSGAGQGVPRTVSHVVPIAMNWPEVLHGRWAMLGTLWCLTPEVLLKYTAVNNCASKGVWFKAGAMFFVSDGLKYKGAPVLMRAQSILAVVAC